MKLFERNKPVADKGADISSFLIKTTSRGAIIVDDVGACSNRPSKC